MIFESNQNRDTFVSLRRNAHACVGAPSACFFAVPRACIRLRSNIMLNGLEDEIGRPFSLLKFFQIRKAVMKSQFAKRIFEECL